MRVRATIRCSYRPRAMCQASPSRACCTAPGSMRGRSPIRAELFPVGPAGSSRQVCSMTLTTPAARRRVSGSGMAWMSRPPEKAPATAGCGGAGPVADPLDELDGGFAASGDGRELVEDEGGVLALPGLAEGGVVGEVLQQQPHAGIRVLAAGQVGGAQVGDVDVLERPAGRAAVEAAGGGGEEVGE